eukprot:TRINITY_DN9370_c0_g1_i2.p1 TRINITY_DN9370_c0_g1~~TRINITY_DN9370_c0_g1_i2.p1  ORF type:complete len:295 (+),score=58.49 TRINITY_DN9370_c0_g1_i2:44-928(+)
MATSFTSPLKSFHRIAQALRLYSSSITEDVIPRIFYLHSGPGSVLSAGIPKGASFIVSTSVCNVLGKSPNLSRRWTYFSNAQEAFYRRTSGAPFFFDQYSTNGSLGDLILSSKHSDDVVIAEIDYGTDLLLSSGSSLLCAGGDLAFTTFWKTPTLKPSLRLSGRGALAFRSPGRIVKMYLEPGESYYVNLKYLVAYESTVVFRGRDEDPNFTSQSPTTDMKIKAEDKVTTLNLSQQAPTLRFLGDNIHMSLKDRISSYFNTFARVSVNKNAPTGATIYLHSAAASQILSKIIPR